MFAKNKKMGLLNSMKKILIVEDEKIIRDELKSLLEKTPVDGMTDSDIDAIKAGKEKLMNSAQKLFAKMYEQSNPGQGAGPDMGGATGNASQDDDVVDGDYKEV